MQRPADGERPLLTVIGDFGFQECRALQVADFPLVTHIGNCGFYLCTSLTEAYVPAVKTIDYNGFNTCRSLQILSISTDLERVNARAFEACSALKSVYVSKTKAEWAPLSIDGNNNEYFLNAQAIFDEAPLSLEALPAMVSVVKGCNGELELRAHGSGLTYSWQMCLPNSDRWIDLSPVAYPTANSPKLIYGPVTAADDGLQLRCAVTNRSGDSLISDVVVLRLTPFMDVPADAYYFTPVTWAVDKGVTAGISPVMFGSDYPCTRAQVVTFLWAAAGRPDPASTVMPFGDVPADAYYRSAVQWAIEKGITSGVSDAAFGPDVTCTRGQIVTMLWRAAGSPPLFDIVIPDIPIEYADAAPASDFTDVQADDYFYQAVQWAVKEEITAGTSASTFSPDAPCTRAQIVTFLYKDSLN